MRFRRSFASELGVGPHDGGVAAPRRGCGVWCGVSAIESDDAHAAGSSGGGAPKNGGSEPIVIDVMAPDGAAPKKSRGGRGRKPKQ